MTRHPSAQKYFQCSIEPINPDSTQTLFTDDEDLEFESTLQRLVFQLGGKPPVHPLRPTREPEPPRNQQALILALMQIQQSPGELKELLEQLNEGLHRHGVRAKGSCPNDCLAGLNTSGGSSDAESCKNPFFDESSFSAAPFSGSVLGKRGDSFFINSFFSFKK